jgi:anti-anti-sigma factor
MLAYVRCTADAPEAEAADHPARGRRISQWPVVRTGVTLTSEWISLLQVDTGTPPPNRVEIALATDDVAVVTLLGEHDLGRYETLIAALVKAVRRARNVVVDLSECAFVDSTTLTLLLHTQNIASKHDGGFAVVIPPDSGSVARLADFVNLGEVLPVLPSLEAAMASFSPEHPGRTAA